MIAKTLRTPDGEFFIGIPLVVEIEASGNGKGSVNSVNHEIGRYDEPRLRKTAVLNRRDHANGILPNPAGVRLWSEIVDFDQADAGGVVQPGQQRGIRTWWQRRRYSRLEEVGRRQTRGH
jgi:hypothetical protein